MILSPPRYTHLYSSAASDVYKRQGRRQGQQVVWNQVRGDKSAGEHEHVYVAAREPDSGQEDRQTPPAQGNILRIAALSVKRFDVQHDVPPRAKYQEGHHH